MSAQESLCFLAPAKINLALHVTGRRGDGYHELDSLVVFADVCDRLSVEPCDRDRFAVWGPFAEGVPAHADNLVVRARDLLRRSLPEAQTAPVSITLEKHLPPSSGIGGGSSDAAAALRALNHLWRLALPAGRLARIGAPAGADIAMCVHARPLLARGIGDEIETIDDWPEMHLVLANPGIALSTPDVFRQLARRQNPPLPPLPAPCGPAGIAQWLAGTRNDLEEPARRLAPQIGTVLDMIAESGASFVRMSGSGATCFGLFETAGGARQAADDLKRAQPRWFVSAARCPAAKENSWDVWTKAALSSPSA